MKKRVTRSRKRAARPALAAADPELTPALEAMKKVHRLGGRVLTEDEAIEHIHDKRLVLLGPRDLPKKPGPRPKLSPIERAYSARAQRGSAWIYKRMDLPDAVSKQGTAARQARTTGAVQTAVLRAMNWLDEDALRHPRSRLDTQRQLVEAVLSVLSKKSEFWTDLLKNCPSQRQIRNALRGRKK